MKKSKSINKILICGYCGFDNTGDEEIARQLIGAVRSVRPDAEITVMSGAPEKTAESENVCAIDRFNMKAVMSAIRKADALIFGGGSLLQDTTSFKSLLYYIIILKAAAFCRKKIMVYANGVGPLESGISKRLVKNAISSAEIITVRDESSKKLLQEIGIKKNIILSADPVFSKTVEKSDEGYIAFAVRDWENGERFVTEAAEFCRKINEATGRRVMLLPLMKPNDTVICRKITEASGVAAEICEGDVISAAAGASVVVSVRYHGLVFAAIGGVPFAAIDYDPKVSEIARQFYMPIFGRYREFNGADAAEKTAEMINQREIYAARVETALSRQRELEKENIRALESFLGVMQRQHN